MRKLTLFASICAHLVRILGREKLPRQIDDHETNLSPESVGYPFNPIAATQPERRSKP